jgi:UDP-N-acetylmuramyl tripeptide synthase
VPDGLRGTRFVLHCGDTARPLTLPMPGLYNLVNALGAVAAARALDLAPAAIFDGVANAVGAFGRLERIRAGRQELILWLVKNPAGFNEALRTLLAHEGRKTLVIAINDRAADGHDVSWLWDVDAEDLTAAQRQLAHIVCAGDRAYDMAVRLKYAGFPAVRQSVRVDPTAAVDRALELATADAPVYAFCTYTAMLDLRAAFRRRGWLQEVWNDR